MSDAEPSKKKLRFATQDDEATGPTASTSTCDLSAGQGRQAPDDNSDNDTDVYSSDEEKDVKNTSLSSSAHSTVNFMNRGVSLVKSYTQMSDSQRKALIIQAFHAKKQLQDELSEVKEQVNTHKQQLEQLKLQASSDRLYVSGECEALQSDQVVYFPLFAQRHYMEGSADQLHFRLAESQFYRLLSSNYGSSYRVTKVEYVVNPKLVEQFKKARALLIDDRGEELSYPLLAFHGTREENITAICQQGFLAPGDNEFKHSTDTGWYGRGVYFSEYPGYAMSYIDGSQRLLLCQILPGKMYQCKNVIHTSHKQSGYDSHSSPDNKELIIFDSTRILPSYIVHYKSSNLEFRYQANQLKVTHNKSKNDLYQDALKCPASRLFIGQTIDFSGELCVSHLQLQALVHKHTSNHSTHADYFHFLVSTQEDYESHSSKINKAIRWGVPIVTEQYIYNSIINKHLETISDYEITG